MTSSVATAVDYVLYLVLVRNWLAPVPANVISYSVGMVINFLLQKRFVFTLQRSVSKAFGLAILVSLGGMVLSTGIIYLLSRVDFFVDRQYLAKLSATGIVFFYNFYLKRFVFEKRFITSD
ncbi:MAG: hypothetical protein DHS20C18_37090 [Saprospiraceae bacterium]|nr:MAG: hypothetical protein DHS20C18_37090 [Saprospiraceae bacterium]